MAEDTINRFRTGSFFKTVSLHDMGNLRQREFTKATLDVEPGDTKNKAIHRHYGFPEYIKSGREYYPDGTAIDVEYYGKSLI